MQAYTDYILDTMTDDEWREWIEEEIDVMEWPEFMGTPEQDDDGAIENDQEWIRMGC